MNCGDDLHHPLSSPAIKDLIERSLVPTDDWMNMQIKGFKPLTLKLAVCCDRTSIDYNVNIFDYMLLFCYGI